MKNLDYRGTQSTEFRLVVGVWLVATYMLIFGVIGEGSWVSVTMTGVFGYVLARVGSKASEAYKNQGVQ